MVDVRDIVIFSGRVARLSGKSFKESKRRPCVVMYKPMFDGERKTVAVPLYSTARKAFGGRGVRIGILPDKSFAEYVMSLTECERKSVFGPNYFDATQFNNLNSISLAAVDNAFFLEDANIFEKIGSVDDVYRLAISYEFTKFWGWPERSSYLE